MPLFTYLDDVIYDGEPFDFKLLALFASYFATLILDVDCQLVGNPRIFYPINPSPLMATRFLEEYRRAFNKLDSLLETSRAHSSSNNNNETTL